MVGILSRERNNQGHNIGSISSTHGTASVARIHLETKYYSHWGKHAQELKFASIHFLTFSAWPGRIHGIPTDLVPQFKEQPA